ncbi:MAG: hypothetical protein WAQ98_09615 [Blastocatellia bacterium]
MKIISAYPVRNLEGQQLLDNFVVPFCKKNNIRLAESKITATRADSLVAAYVSNLLLWDCSVESGHVYNAFNEKVKNQRKHIIVSRTPLPRNVLTYNQFAPIHGEKFSNDLISDWLEKKLSFWVKNGYFAQDDINNKIAHNYWLFDNPAKIFLSFRGTKLELATAWSQKINSSIRMVPESEYAYKTECLTRQQMWEGVARLTHEMTVTSRVVIFFSDDYFDSFWTSSELLSLIKHRKDSNNRIKNTYLLTDYCKTKLEPLYIESRAFPVKPITLTQSHRLFKILNNTDPLTVAPETYIAPRGMAKILAFFLKPTMGYYDPEFTSNFFWKTLLVPCPKCKPNKRPIEEVSWENHLYWKNSTQEKDYFGYFPSSNEQLLTGSVKCPWCNTHLKLKCDRSPRTIWAPIQTTEENQNRPVIQEHPLWEVVTE